MKPIDPVRNPKQVPVGPHFAVLVYDTTSVWIPGDERSRTNPGHGYPEHTETYDNFQHYVTEDEEVLGNLILSLTNEKKPFVVLKVEKKLNVAVKAVVEF